MEVRAVAKYVRVQPRKVRLVAAEVKGSPAVMSAHKLAYHPSKGAKMLRKVLVSAIANAVENNRVSPESLRIARISIDEGPRMKRITQRSMGRANRIIKKTSHITVVLEDYEPMGEVKPHGTKAKPRPKFEAPKAKKASKKAEEAVAPVEETPVEETPVDSATEEAPATTEAAEENKD
ncbi:MAG: 50S ribosomal protein L22 [Armatimonadetes bacterium]|nr:50S ribosomal protein L22 [Armatimonadota bacterium]